MKDASQTRSVDELTQALQAGAKAKYVLFWGHTGKPGHDVGPWVFSQWFHAPFEHEGCSYPTAEHWMMAGKARLFDDDKALAAILAASSPAEAKHLGRTVRRFDEATWVAKRFELVVEGNVLKFSSSETLRKYLLGTKNRVLVEASPADRIWGVGFAADHANATRPDQWRGLNLLGFALMQARARLLDAGAQ
ncbi:MAG: NADAR family protein [Myxococcota bacterium]